MTSADAEFLSRVVERLGADWPGISFDTFGGFPPRRSPLDMYDHPGCVFTDLAAGRYLDERNVEIVHGDIARTCQRLEREDLVLTFIDTDNYTPALEIVRNAPWSAARSSLTISPERTGSATRWESA